MVGSRVSRTRQGVTVYKLALFGVPKVPVTERV
jgi:hypothetical protein